MPYLEIQSPKGTKRLELDREPITVGRLPENKIQLADAALSRRHCVIEPDDAGWKMRDLGSRNGTRLNDSHVTEAALFNGDQIRIGQLTVRFIDPQRPRADSAAPADRDAQKRYEKRRHRQKEAEVASTLDINLKSLVESVKSDHEQTLQDICDAAAEQPFGADDISLVDARGSTVHQAASSGFTPVKESEEAESIRVFRLVLLAAFRSRATDIHIEPREEKATIRLRVDGQMVHAAKIDLILVRRLLGLTKILCEIDTSQKAAVQDGHFSARAGGRRVDYRVSLTPVVHGQKLVIRILDGANAPSRLHDLGLIPWMYEKIRKVATRDSGMLLVSGPTGSGKTTTLYSCLREIDVESRNAVTIEDPVEYHLEGATQIPIDHKQGNTFATILRSVLRQDPDVIFVGEVRDLETASVATQAAMTGHLVYSTVHARDSIGSVFRLLDLGLEPYLVANALNLVMAQRLIRILCSSCRKRVKPTSAQTLAMGKYVEGVDGIYAPQGCAACLGTGFLGRRALFELLELNDELRDAILKTPTIAGIKKALSGGHFVTLRQYGLQLVANGETSFDEVDRVCSEG